MSFDWINDWDKVGDGSDAILIDGFARDYDYGDENGYPEGTIPLHRVGDDERVEDRNGNRFRVMDPGSVQGSVIVRDRYRRMYQTDCGVIVKPLDN